MIATLSGWGQPHDALKSLLPAAHAVDYTGHTSAKAALLDIAHQCALHDIIVGWSLGGQLAIRAIAAGLIRPKALVLIAAPYQFVASPELKIGMPLDLYEKFRANYAANPAKTLRMAWETILRGDNHANTVREHLAQQDMAHTTDWLAWLDTLHAFTCDGLYLADFPPTLLIHGDKDAVVHHDQSERLAQAIPHAKLLTLSGCGHAPHWHNPALVQQAITDFTHV